MHHKNNNGRTEQVKMVEFHVLAIFANFSSKDMSSTQVTRAHYQLVLKSTYGKKCQIDVWLTVHCTSCNSMTLYKHAA